MKKLMIAAAAAAMIGGAYADTCIGCGGGTVWEPTDYDYYTEYINQIPGHIWDISLKATTLVKKCMKCSADCVSCGDENKVSYYEKGTRTFTGVAWTCYEPCRNYANYEYDEYTGDNIQEQDNENNDSANVLMWDASKKIPYGHIIRYTYRKEESGKIYTYSYGVLCGDVAATTLQEINGNSLSFGRLTSENNEMYREDDNDAFRFGKKATSACWTLSYNGSNDCDDDEINQKLTFGAVAFGSIKTYKNKGYEDYTVIEKATGGAVGTVTACVCDEFGLVVPVCYAEFESWCDDGYELSETPFYGTITLKYNAKKSQQLRTTARFLVTAGKVFPKYCFAEDVVIDDGE